MDTKLIVILLVCGLVAFVVNKIASKFKIPKISCVSLVTGGVKSGKSTFSVYLSIKTYKRIHRSWKVRSWFQKLFHANIDEEPLLYSNIPLAVPYVPITLDLLLRKVRPAYLSLYLRGELWLK